MLWDVVLFPFCFLAAWGIGALALRACRCPRQAADWFLAYLAGCGVIGTVIFLLLLAGVYRTWEAVVLLVAGLGCACFRVIRPWIMPHGASGEGDRRMEPADARTRWRASVRAAMLGEDLRPAWIPAVPAVVVLLLLLVGSLTPAFGGDELWYHLMLPRLYLQEGRMFPIPYNVPSHYPLLAEMVYVWALSLAHAPLCKLLQWAAFASAAGIVARWGREDGGRRAGALAALLLVTARAAAYNRAPCQAGSDEWLLAFLTAMLFLLTRPAPAFAAGGMFLGMALAAKLTALVYGLLPVSAILVLQYRRPRLKSTIVCLVVGLAVVAAWWIRTAVWTGNPLFPLAMGFFPSVGEAARFAAPLIGGQLGTEPFVWAAARPLEWLLETAAGKATQCAYEGNFLFWGTLWLPIIAIMSRSRGIRALGVYGTVTGVVFLASHVSHAERFFAVTQFVPALLAGIYLHQVLTRVRPFLRTAATAAVAALCFVTYWQHQSKWNRLSHIDWHWDPPMTSRQVWEFLETRETVPPMRAAYAWIDSKLPDDATLLLIGCWGEFYCPRRIYPPGERLVPHLEGKLAEGEQAFRDFLVAQGVTHVLVGRASSLDPRFASFRDACLETIWEGPEGVTLARFKPEKNANAGSSW